MDFLISCKGFIKNYFVLEKKTVLLHFRLNGSESVEGTIHLKNAFQPLFNSNQYLLNRTAISELEMLLIKNQFNNLTKVVQTITWSCEEIIRYCAWQDEVVDCTKIFSEVFFPMEGVVPLI